MSGLPADYMDALAMLSRATERYRRETGRRMVIVGGAAVAFYTQGAILSGDFDLVADLGFESSLLAEGCRREDRSGRMRRGFYHPDLPRYGFELVSGALFDGRTDSARIQPVAVGPDAHVLFPPVEDLIADRLGQYAASNQHDHAMLRQARLLFRLAATPDRTYLRRRIVEETGDPDAIDLT